MKTVPFASISILVALALLGWYFFGFARSGDLGKTKLRVGAAEFSVELADNTAAQARGLSGRAGLGVGEGMLFRFGRAAPRSFWMKDMRFPIDMVWIRDGKVLGVTHDVQPEPGVSVFRLTLYSSPGPADAVLELASGAAARSGIAAGAEVEIMGE